MVLLEGPLTQEYESLKGTILFRILFFASAMLLLGNTILVKLKLWELDRI